MPYYSDMRDKRTALYRIFSGETLLYVGISLDIDARLAAHSRRDWWPDVDDITVQWFAGREGAKAAERAAIRDEAPLHNVARPAPSIKWREVS